jgi:hypothetical protein
VATSIALRNLNRTSRRKIIRQDAVFKAGNDGYQRQT